MSGWETLTVIEKAVAVTTAVSAGTAIYSTVEQRKALKQEEAVAEIDATAREIQRTKRMNAYMASVNAQSGAGGVNPGVGSIANLQEVKQRENKIGTQSERANLDATRRSVRSKRRASLATGVSDVASTATQGAAFFADSD